MFPMVLRYTSFLLYRVVPSQLLPPTYEALVVWSGVLFNNLFCLIVSTLALYDLTNHIGIVTTERSYDDSTTTTTKRHDKVSVAVCLVFGVWNPAYVFFATNYSESFFAMTTLLGYVCMQRSSFYSNTISRRHSGWWWLMGIVCWMIGSYTRSNGTVHCLWIFQDGVARILRDSRLIHQQQKQQRQYDCSSSSGATRSSSTASTTNSRGTMVHILWIFLRSILGIILVALPVRYHDWRGYQRHCNSKVPIQPTWCTKNIQNQGIVSSLIFGSSHSLYRYIQEKHWNVGFFRYYQWKQIPNFLLAAPILMLSVGGACLWIYWSLVVNFGKGKMPSTVSMIFWSWPIDALVESVEQTSREAATFARVKKTKRNHKDSLLSRDALVDNPLLLGQYAILAVLALVGIVIAHVQISTRMICSTSPALIWFITYCLLAPPSNEAARSGTSPILPPSYLGQIVWYYTALFMLLGVVLHVNFLPWT
jgi:phosphatidylinositol glycan class V